MKKTILKKKYNISSFLIMGFCFAPKLISCKTLLQIIDGLLPAWQTISIAAFVTAVFRVYQGIAQLNEIALPIMGIIGYMLYSNLMPSVYHMLDLGIENDLSLRYHGAVLEKKSKLKYEYIENKDSMDLIKRTSEKDVENMMKAIGMVFGSISLIISIGSLTFIIMRSSWSTALLMIIISIPCMILSVRLGQKNYEIGKETQRIERRYNYLAKVLESREYAEERTLFRYSDSLIKQYKELFIKAFRVRKMLEIKHYIQMKAGSVISVGLIFVLILCLYRNLIDGTMELGIFVGLISAMLSLVQKMSWQLSSLLYERAEMGEYVKDFTEFINLKEMNDADCESNDPTIEFESLEFRNVTFSYPGTDKHILKQCSFQLTKDKTYALVGLNGCGKSTIIKLICGMYDNYDGDILINGKNIKEWPLSSIKGMIGIIFQDFMKYEDSLNEAIDINPIEDKRFHTICQHLQLQEFIKQLPEGIHTNLGRVQEKGVGLSGGEWQKIALARMLYGNKPFQILDEPTAALDPIAENRLYRQFWEISKEHTTLFITHRLGAARMADQILMLSDGRIVERGSHEELMGHEGSSYREMFLNQKSWYEEDEVWS